MIRLYGPNGFIDRVHHKLLAYRWNLVDRFIFDLIFVVTEIDSDLGTHTAQLRLKNAFAIEAAGKGPLIDGVLHSEPSFRVMASVLEHRTPCLGFAHRGNCSRQRLEKPAERIGTSGRVVVARTQARGNRE